MNRNGSVNPAEDFELIPASRDSFRRPLEHRPSAPSGSDANGAHVRTDTGRSARGVPVSFKKKHRLLGRGGGPVVLWFSQQLIVSIEFP